MNTIRIGQGFDIHPLVAGRDLIIGGVAIPYERGLQGHSDADVLLHALCDALLGAAALGDIGRHFSDTDARFKNIDSRKLVREVHRLLIEASYQIVNVDATIIAQAPKMVWLGVGKGLLRKWFVLLLPETKTKHSYSHHVCRFACCQIVSCVMALCGGTQSINQTGTTAGKRLFRSSHSPGKPASDSGVYWRNGAP